MIIVYILIGCLLWFLIGCIVLSSIDHNEELYHWVWDKAPNYTYSILAIYFWPLLVFMYLHK